MLNNPHIMLDAIEKSYESFEFATSNLKSDQKFILSAVKID